MRPRQAPWNAYVLHRYDWSESSLILDLYTREGGRIAAAAKGAKRPSSSFRPVLLPFQALHVSLARRHGDDEDEVQTLRSAEWAGTNAMASTLLRGAALFRGFYLNELLMKLLPRGEPYAQLYDAYAQTLSAVAVDDDAAAGAAIRGFELVLLKELGWLADLSAVTATQAPLRPEVRYTLRADGVVPSGPGSEGIAGVLWLRMHSALGERAHDELRHICEDPAAAPLRQMLRPLIAMHMGHTLLRTREVALGLRRLSTAAGRSLKEGTSLPAKIATP
jgi:DNA repair protein RecO (recombination protein O)